MTAKSRNSSPVTVSGQQSLVRGQAAGAHDEGHEATIASREPSDAGTTVRAGRRILLCNNSRPRNSVVVGESVSVSETVFRSMPGVITIFEQRVEGRPDPCFALAFRKHAESLCDDASERRETVGVRHGEGR